MIKFVKRSDTQFVKTIKVTEEFIKQEKVLPKDFIVLSRVSPNYYRYMYKKKFGRVGDWLVFSEYQWDLIENEKFKQDYYPLECYEPKDFQQSIEFLVDESIKSGLSVIEAVSALFSCSDKIVEKYLTDKK